MKKMICLAATVGCIAAGLFGGSAASAAPDPSLVGLCHAYPGVANSHGKALANPAFATLIGAAGGMDAVPAYCTALIGA